jgi:hypothetical protein
MNPPHVYIEDLKKHVGQDVTIKGWLYNRRAKGKIAPDPARRVGPARRSP